MDTRFLVALATVVAATGSAEQRPAPVAPGRHQVVIAQPAHDPSQPRTPAVRLPVPHAPRDAYEHVFPVPQIVVPGGAVQTPAPSVKRHAAPRIVCGMTLFPADPAIDPGIVRVPERHSTVEYSIRRFHPTVCVEPDRR